MAEYHGRQANFALNLLDAASGKAWWGVRQNRQKNSPLLAATKPKSEPKPEPEPDPEVEPEPDPELEPDPEAGGSLSAVQ